jgi:acetyltransferase
MTTRNLEAVFRPRSVAIIGASERAGSVGSVVLRNVVDGGFAGEIFPVNPKYRTLRGLTCYAAVRDLPSAPDLAVIATPPATIPELIASLADRGCRGAVILTAGLGTADNLRQRMLDAARPSLLRILGPNSIGLLCPHVSLNASFAHIAPQAGRLGLISQSGAIVSSVVDWAAAQRIGFSQIMSLGDMADVDVGDCINWLAADPQTSAILMYLESIPAPRKFMSAARAASRVKPVIAIKPGRHPAAAQAAMTHTGSLAGRDDVVDAALRRAGVIRVDSLEDLFHAAEITARFRPLRQARVAIVTNGGGAGVLAVDALLDRGCCLGEPGPQTMHRLDAVLPPTWSKANPVDIIGDAPASRYREALAAVAADPGVDALLVMNCPTALASPLEAARAVCELAANDRLVGKPLIACWLGKAAAEPARALLRTSGIATADTPGAAAEAISLLTRWSALRARLDRVPPRQGGIATDRATAAQVIVAAGAEGRSLLTEPEAKAVLRAYGIDTPCTLVARDEAAVAAHAATLLEAHPGGVVVKLLSRSITHKSDVGGVVLGLRDAAAAAEAAGAIRQRLADRGMAGAIDGFTVQPMVSRPQAEELIVGLSRDPGFGPIVLFGAGGISVEVVADTAVGLVPLDDVLAGDLIERTRISALLAGYRDHPAADRDAIVGAIVALSQLAVDFPCIRAADINPLLADADGVIALDARMEIEPHRAAEQGPGPELVVRPYPSGWDRTIDAGGQHYQVRPLRPADAALYPRFLDGVTADDMRLRFLVSTRTLSAEALVRLTQLDYDRDMAFVALDAAGDLAGIVRYASDPDHLSAEFSAHVRSDLQGQGLGTALLQLLVEYAAADGLAELTGVVLRENRDMLAVASALGFSVIQDPHGDADETVRISRRLDRTV